MYLIDAKIFKRKVKNPSIYTVSMKNVEILKINT